ncbi:hypothetical protein PoMZ_07201, partial [Pyricularia oryzae]
VTFQSPCPCALRAYDGARYEVAEDQSLHLHRMRMENCRRFKKVLLRRADHPSPCLFCGCQRELGYHLLPPAIVPGSVTSWGINLTISSKYLPNSLNSVYKVKIPNDGYMCFDIKPTSPPKVHPRLPSAFIVHFLMTLAELQALPPPLCQAQKVPSLGGRRRGSENPGQRLPTVSKPSIHRQGQGDWSCLARKNRMRSSRGSWFLC